MYSVNAPKIRIKLELYVYTSSEKCIEWKQLFVNSCTDTASGTPSGRTLIILILANVQKVKLKIEKLTANVAENTTEKTLCISNRSHLPLKYLCFCKKGNK